MTPFKGFEWKTSFTYDREHSNDHSCICQRYYGYYSYDYETGLYHSTDRYDNSVSQNKVTSSVYTLQNTAKYQFDINDIHRFGFILGNEYTHSSIEKNSLSGYVTDVVESYSTNEFGDSERYGGPTFDYIDRLTDSNSKRSTDEQKHTLLSFFGRMNYSLLNRYLLQASLRADGWADSENSRIWGYSPAVGAGWIITNEKFMQASKSWLDNLKLRASYGRTANIVSYPTAYTDFGPFYGFFR